MEELDSSNVFVDLGLDEAQRDLAYLIASNVKCDHAQSVQIVWGAPGTGKTRMLSALLEAFQGRKANILVSKQSGFGRSLFERLISQGFYGNKLTVQYKIHPSISSFPNRYFYKGEISAGSYINSKILNSNFSNYVFINTDNSKESALILRLLRIIIQEWRKQRENLDLQVGLICSSIDVGKIGHLQDKISRLSITVQSMNHIKEDTVHDVLLFSTYGFPIDDRGINYALNISRDYLWIVGDENVLYQDLTWRNLIIDAKRRKYFVDAKDLPILSDISQFDGIDMSNLDNLASTLGLIVCQPVQPVQEFSWVGRSYNGKVMLSPVRDQRGENHCTLCSSLSVVEFLNKHKCASLHAPSDFLVDLSIRRLLEIYDAEFIGIGEEEGDKGKGIKRLENVLSLIQSRGAKSEYGDEVYRISSYERIYYWRKGESRPLEIIAQQLRKGKAFIGTFKMSLNYIRYKPGDIYEFKLEKPILAPLSNQPTSHAVMIVGGTEPIDEMPLGDRHLVMQNSQGTYFGHNGIGRVKCSSINNLYQINL
ncbi:hypothetical protein ACP4OV_024256 [Aristida adscensionis]